jgi:DNA-binding NarL/FixJ family response regulator
MEKHKDERLEPKTAMFRAAEGRNGRAVLSPLKEAGVGRVPGIRIECPYPLLTAGLVRALEETLPHRQGFERADAFRVVVLWAENVENLSEDVQRLRETNPDASVVILGLREELSLAWAALQAGARGFVHAGMQPDQIARAISVAAKGEVVVPRGLVEYLATEASRGESAERGVLKPRQQQTLELVANGLSNAEIARRLYLSESTVKQHLRAAYKILGVRNRTEAAKLIRDSQGR